MSATEVCFTSEIIQETYQAQWKIKDFDCIHYSSIPRNLLSIEIETDSSAKLEARFIIGFTSSAKDYGPEITTPGLNRPYKKVEPLVYCKLVKLPSNMEKLGVRLTINSDLDRILYGESSPFAYCHAQICHSLKLNEQMETLCEGLDDSLDEEGSLYLSVEVAIMTPVSIKSKPSSSTSLTD